ncbi:MAG TPA: precorrin-6y C5,15-methyltransferase (decarboxylating) subunit CbiE [Dehalococcoidia bacterium]|nr:precorrin-6y C5,15-methyltransferase (decarboxylating) subunit CbiE [Dehalococcoidia bacterium]
MAELLPIWIVGVGPGHPSYITAQAAALVQAAGVVAGSKIPMETVSRWVQGERIILEDESPQAQLKILAEKAAMGHRCVVCAQGDPSFSARELIDQVAAVWRRVEVVPGISPVQTVCARTGLDMDRSLCINFHKQGDMQADQREFLRAALEGSRNLFVLPKPRDFPLPVLAQFLIGGGIPKDRPVSVYESLTLAEEQVTIWKLGELAGAQREFSDNSVFVLPASAG